MKYFVILFLALLLSGCKKDIIPDDFAVMLHKENNSAEKLYFGKDDGTGFIPDEFPIAYYDPAINQLTINRKFIKKIIKTKDKWIIQLKEAK